MVFLKQIAKLARLLKKMVFEDLKVEVVHKFYFRKEMNVKLKAKFLNEPLLYK